MGRKPLLYKLIQRVMTNVEELLRLLKGIEYSLNLPCFLTDGSNPPSNTNIEIDMLTYTRASIKKAKVAFNRIHLILIDFAGNPLTKMAYDCIISVCQKRSPSG